MTIDIQNIKTLNNVSQFNFSCHKNDIHLARTGSSVWWLLLISTSMFPHFQYLTIRMPHCWVPLNDTDSRITCGLQFIILRLQLHNTHYSWTTWEFRLGTKGFSAPKMHFTIKSYLFIWPCLWKNSKQYYDKFVNHWQSEKQEQKFHTDDASLSRPG